MLKRSIVALLFLIAAASATHAAPIIALTAPAAGSSYVAPAAIDVRADASTSTGSIARVEFFQDGVLFGTALNPPYQASFTNALPGNYILTARAKDTRGLVTKSAGIAVTVVNPVSVSLTSPSAPARFLPQSSIELSANASDSRGRMARVDFYQGATLIGSDDAAPYHFSWTPTISGRYSVTARAINSDGISKTSSAVTVIVNAPPTIRLSTPTAEASWVGLATIPLAAEVTDVDGQITAVRFYHGGTLIGTATAPPYIATWTDAPPGSYVISARAADNLGGTTISDKLTIVVANPVTVTLQAPLKNARFVPPASIDVTADAHSSKGSIAKVEFFSGDAFIGSATHPPFSINWTNVAAGRYRITALATDTQGISKTSAAMPILVDAAPLVSLSSPPPDSRYDAPAVIPLVANVTDPDGGIARVQFFNGSVLLATVSSPPYRYDWRNVGAGDYTVRARVTDALGMTANSAGVRVHVVAATPPVVSLSVPLPNPGLRAPAAMTLAAEASAGAGRSITKVEFFNGADLLGSVPQAPYTLVWSAVAAGNYMLRARATDSSGVTGESSPVGVTVVAAAPRAEVFYIEADHLNTPRMITDVDGNVMWRWSGEPFGSAVPEEVSVSGTPLLTFNLRFPGQYFDEETRLHYNYFRDYDPATGRFVESDPIGLDGGVNTYGYVRNSPIQLIDFFGLVESVVLRDDAIVCRGGLCTGNRFANGSGVTFDGAGNMLGVSTSSMNDKTLRELSCSVKHGNLGWTTVGDIRAAGGSATHSPTAANPYHTAVEGITPAQGEKLFKPNVTRNPSLTIPGIKILGPLSWLGIFLDFKEMMYKIMKPSKSDCDYCDL